MYAEDVAAALGAGAAEDAEVCAGELAIEDGACGALTGIATGRDDARHRRLAF